MKLKFIADAYYNGEHVYKKGQVVEIDNSKGMASRWLRRNLAIEFEDKKVEVVEEVVEEVSPEEVVVEIEEVKVESPKRRKSKKEE